MPKTPEYTTRAINNYKSKFDNVMIRIPKGNKQLIEDRYNTTVNKLVNELLKEYIETH